MPISFNEIPASVLTPTVLVEVDNSRAFENIFFTQKNILVIGQRLAAGTVPALELKTVFNDVQADEFFGVGSMLSRMLKVVRDNIRGVEVKAIALDDNLAGVDATGVIAFTGSVPTQAGTLFCYIAGELVQIKVLVGDTDDDIAANLTAAINLKNELPVVAVVGATTSEVELTAKHAGEVGNDIDIRFNYFGESGGEKFPPGVTAVITDMAGGTGNPDIGPALAALPDEIYSYFVAPYTDSNNMLKIEDEMNERFGANKQLEGHYFSAKKDSLNDLSTFGNTRNNPHVTVMGYDDSPTPTETWAAAYAAQVAWRGSIDPARPFQTLPLEGVLAPPIQSVFKLDEQDVLLNDGIATFTVARDGTVQIQRAVTMYKTNTVGQPDISFRDTNTLLTVSELRQSIRRRLASKFARFKLADDGTRFGPGQAIVTPKIIKAEIVAWFAENEFIGLVEDVRQFKADLIVERNTMDPNRVDILLPPDLVNQLRVQAIQLQFRL